MNTLKKIDYLPFLESCWQEHLKPRADNAPTVISTFSGCGGSSLGYSMAGFRELLAIEWDDNAVETFKLNFPNIPVYHGDIAKISVEQALEITGLKPGELDILDGSPPCQGFSTAGKRIMGDSRNNLFREYIRLLQGLKPKVFIMENVSGMIKGKMKIIFAEIMRELKASGYRVSARLLNAMYFGVPQNRQRLIFIGIRNDLEIAPSYPNAEYVPVSMRKAIENKSGNDLMPRIAFNHSYVKRIQELKPGQNIGQVYGQGFNWIRCDDSKPCPTISKSTTYGKLGFLFLSDGSRNLSSREMARCHSFCDKFDFTGDYVNITARIGNSVPPLFMRAIALHIRHEILDRLSEAVLTL